MSEYRSCTVAIGFIIYMAVSMLVGALVVCLSARENTTPPCAEFVWTINAKPISTNAHPRYIITHDFNNDEKLDIAVANFGSNTIGIFLAVGNGTFASQVTYTTGNGSLPTSLATGDFNNDGQWDLVVANFGSHSVDIFIGDHNGTFKRQTTISVGSSRPLRVAVGDFNNDTRLDIVVINAGTNIVGILFGYGDGTFTDQVELSATYDSLPQSVVVSDFNNDQKTDLAVANFGSHNVVIFFGDGNGTFSVRTTVSTGIGSRPYALAVADFNNDAQMDIVVANSGTDTICILLGSDHQTFVMQGTYTTGARSQPISIAVGDFNHDRRIDVLVSNNNSNTIGIFLGFNNGAFANQTTFPTGADSMPYSAIGGDFNNDDRLDIAVATYTTNTIIILLALSNATFANQTTYSSASVFRPTSIVLGNFNNDDRLDAVAVDTNSCSIRIFLADTNGYFSNQEVLVDERFQFTDPLATGDFNNDTREDIAVGYRNDWHTGIAILFGESNGSFSNFAVLRHEHICNSPSISVHDVNNDHRLDIVLLCPKMDYIFVALGYGNGSFADTQSSAIPTNPSRFAVADFDKDGQLDIAVTYKIAFDTLYGAVVILFGNGTGYFSNETSYSTGYYPQTEGIAVSDFDNDTNLDIVVTNPQNDKIGIFFGFGDGTFAEQKTYSTGLDSHALFVVAADFNNDSLVDIVFDHQSKCGIAVLLGYGNGTFASQVMYPTSRVSRPGAIAFGDLNNDTLLDIVVVNTDDQNIGVFLGFAPASFRYLVSLSTQSSTGAYSVALADFNEDNQIDIVVANSITDNIGVFLRDASGAFPVQVTYSTGHVSAPTSVITDDLNNDTHSDIIVCNWGVDSVSIFFGYGNGSFDRPKTYFLDDGSNSVAIDSGDFNGDQQPDLIVANYARDTIDVLLQYNSAHFTSQLFYSTGDGSNPHGFALGDFNNDQQVDIAVANNGQNNIGILLGKDNGTFAPQTVFSLDDDFLPVTVSVADLDNDARQDIAILDNVNHRLVITKGDGTGNFSTARNYDTGRDSWPGAMTIGHLDDDYWLDIVVCNFKTNQLKIFFGNDQGDFTRTILYSFNHEAGPYAVAIDDFNDDNISDIATANFKAGSVSILLREKNGTFSQEIILPTGNGSNPAAIVVDDFNQDGFRDIAVANSGSDCIIIFFGNGNGMFLNSTTLSTGTRSQPSSLSIADVNHDGIADILVANAFNDNVGIFLGYVKGSFFRQITYATDYNAYSFSAVFVDLNHDNLMDIIVCNRNNDNIGVFSGYAGGNDFLRLPSYFLPPSSQPTYIVAGHFNDDGLLDVAVANYGSNDLMILFGSGYGTFTSETMYPTGPNSMPHWVTAGDVNQDGRIDLVVANGGASNVGIFLQNVDGTFSSQTTYPTGAKSEPSSVIIGDFNNDTLADLVVANYGSGDVDVLFGYKNGSFTNQRAFSMGFGSRPLALASADMNNDNVSDIVVVNNGYGTTTIIVKLC